MSIFAGRLVSIMLIVAGLFLICTAIFKFVEDKNKHLAPGLYDENDVMLASWDELVNHYGLDVETDYELEVYKGVIPMILSDAHISCVLGSHADLSTGVKLVVGAEVTKIGDYAFRGSSLSTIVLPRGITSIGDMAFAQSKSLEAVYYTGSQKQWDTVKGNDCFFYGAEFSVGG